MHHAPQSVLLVTEEFWPSSGLEVEMWWAKSPQDSSLVPPLPPNYVGPRRTQYLFCRAVPQPATQPSQQQACNK
jgi:hypothetical protein